MNIFGSVMFCFCENRKGISQMYPKIEDFVLFIHLLAKLGHLKSIAYILVKTGYLGKSLFRVCS